MAQCWVEVDLEKVRANFRALQVLVGPDADIIAVVKANAYGLGAPEVSRVLEALGARFLAVTRAEEGVALREASISAPILLMSPTPLEDVPLAVEHDLTLCLATPEEVQSVAHEAKQQNRTASVGLKINTGMNRFGVDAEHAVERAQQIVAHPELRLETCWTHFADAGEPRPWQTQNQFGHFNALLGPLMRATNLSQRDFHCANSSALLRFRSMRLSCVRSGTLLFGQFPGGEAAQAGAREGLKLQDPFSVRARVLSLQKVASGATVGYGNEWRASRDSIVATLGIGFADGLSLSPQARDEGALALVGKNLALSGREAARGIKGLAKGRRFPPGGACGGAMWAETSTKRLWWAASRCNAATWMSPIYQMCAWAIPSAFSRGAPQRARTWRGAT
jgi:alanine racemase